MTQQLKVAWDAWCARLDSVIELAKRVIVPRRAGICGSRSCVVIPSHWQCSAGHGRTFVRSISFRIASW